LQSLIVILIRNSWKLSFYRQCHIFQIQRNISRNLTVSSIVLNTVFTSTIKSNELISRYYVYRYFRGNLIYFLKYIVLNGRKDHPRNYMCSTSFPENDSLSGLSKFLVEFRKDMEKGKIKSRSRSFHVEISFSLSCDGSGSDDIVFGTCSKSDQSEGK